MNGALIRKELRELLPWGILLAVLALSEFAELFVQQVDMLPLGATFSMLNDGATMLYWIVAFAIGTGLAVREHDDRTVQFLDGLPVSRTRVFLIKCAVMCALVLLAPLVRVLALLLLHALSRGSLDGEWRPLLLGQALGLQWLVLLHGLMLGAALGRLRSLTWLVAGSLFALLLVMIERIPRLAALNPITLIDWQISAAGLRIDGEAIALQVIVTAVAFAIAWRGFVRGGAPKASRITDRPFVGAAVTFATVVAGGVVIALLVQRNPPPLQGAEAAEGAVSIRFYDGPPARTQTEHYRFSYPTSRASAALALADDADDVFERVHAQFGVPLGPPIDVDASGSRANTHGTAFYERIQMTLDSDVRMVLAHETAHVVAHRIVGQVRSALWSEAPVWSEGLASWVDVQFRGQSSLQEDRLRVLAALHARRGLIADELANPLFFDQQLDDNLKYTAGFALANALVRVYGDSAPRRLLEAFGDPGLPSDVRGMRMWQAVFQHAGMDVGAVIDEFYREVNDAASRHADWIAGLPRPRALLVRDGDRYFARLLVDRASNERFVLRTRPAGSRSITNVRMSRVAPGGEIELPAREIAAGRVCMQPGLRVGEEHLFERWSCVPVAEATPRN